MADSNERHAEQRTSGAISAPRMIMAQRGGVRAARYAMKYAACLPAWQRHAA